MRRILAILAMLAGVGGCACLDDEPSTSSVKRIDTNTGDQFRRTMRTTTSGCCGTATEEETLIWNRQPDGSYKYAGRERRSL
jgi:hypothetical protein